jgi:uncharacterized protein (TIGR02246 family)
MHFTATFSICLATILPLLAQTAATHTDETAIRRIVSQYVAAREDSDAASIARLFTEDADQLVSTGEWRTGRDAVVRGTLASSQANSGKRSITVETVRFLSADIALADGRYEIAGAGGTQTRRMWTTLLMKRTPGGWRIAAIRNMLPAPPAAGPARGVKPAGLEVH